MIASWDAPGRESCVSTQDDGGCNSWNVRSWRFHKEREFFLEARGACSIRGIDQAIDVKWVGLWVAGASASATCQQEGRTQLFQLSALDGMVSCRV